MNTEAMDALRARLGLRLKRINGTMISIAVEVPSIVLNRAFGFGLSETATENGIGRICAVYREDDLDSFT